MSRLRTCDRTNHAHAFELSIFHNPTTCIQTYAKHQQWSKSVLTSDQKPETSPHSLLKPLVIASY